MTEGVLIVNNKTLQVKFINKKGKEVPFNVKESELSAPILDKKKTAIAQLDGLEVELEEVGGQPKKIREKGQEWEPPQEKFFTQTQKHQKNYQKQPIPNQAISQIIKSNIIGEFHNPYNFIPAPPRNTKHPELGDHNPIGHGSYRQNCWSGKIAVKLTTITPLLIPDAANFTEDKNQHKTYPIRVDAEKKPCLPPTSIKGMLRSAYEAITNSRFGIFEKHEDRLAYRTPAKITVVPARVEKREDQLYLRIMNESGLVGGAAKLQRYDLKRRSIDRGEQFAATKYDGTKTIPKHGYQVWVKINAKGKVTHIRQWKNNPPASDGQWKKGWVCVTGANINGKVNERVFIENENNESILVTESLKSLWEELIRNYQKTHEKALEKRKQKNKTPQDYLGNKPGETAWSRHIWDEKALLFQEGTLCYVELKDNKVVAIQPVIISRRLYKIPPTDLLAPSLKPANSIDELSPADRVFGWVKQNRKNNNYQKGATSYKGNLRIFKVTCDSNEPIEYFGAGGFPLANLGQPNEQQARFYGAKDKQGNPLNTVNKEEGYSDKKQGLRGRKVYPHHNGLPDDHWHNPMTYKTEVNPGHYQEYRQPPGEKEKTDQNRSILAWVKPKVEFSFIIDLINLSSVELGALLWLLSLEKNQYHRLGGGKPLGFGSVKLSIDWDKTDLRKGQDWKNYYSSLIPVQSPEKLDEQGTTSLIQKFHKAVEHAYPQGSFIQAFRIAAQGFEDKLPIHYPRTTQKPNPNGEGFHWFVVNESINQTEGGLKLSLPFLEQDKGLPLNPSQKMSSTK